MDRKTKISAPDGYSSVCPYLMVENVEMELKFLSEVFNAEIVEELKIPDGSIIHGEVRINEVTILLGKSRPEHASITSMNYIFSDDVDKSYKLALKKGAKSLMKPSNQIYGFRECGVEDPQGNQWWIAKRIEIVSDEEIQKRMNELNK